MLQGKTSSRSTFHVQSRGRRHGHHFVNGQSGRCIGQSCGAIGSQRSVASNFSRQRMDGQNGIWFGTSPATGHGTFFRSSHVALPSLCSSLISIDIFCSFIPSKSSHSSVDQYLALYLMILWLFIITGGIAENLVLGRTTDGSDSCSWWFMTYRL